MHTLLTDDQTVTRRPAILTQSVRCDIRRRVMEQEGLLQKTVPLTIPQSGFNENYIAKVEASVFIR